MRFSSDEAFEFRGTDDAIILDRKAVRRILDQHNTEGTLSDFLEEMAVQDAERVDAGDLLAWLGY